MSVTPNTIVLKTGLDRPVRPVELGTDQVSNPVMPKESLPQKIGVELAKSAKNR